MPTAAAHAGTQGRHPTLNPKQPDAYNVLKHPILIVRGIVAMLVLTLLLVKELVFTHGFFVYTFFRPSISDVPPPVKLDVGYWNKLQFKIILLARYLLKNQFLLHGWYRRVHNQILKRVKAQNLDQAQVRLPIETVTPGAITPREFYDRYVRKSIPVIIKGGASDSFAVKNWTPEYFAEKYGEFPANIINQNTAEHFVGSFADVVASRGTDRKLYIHNSANIFSFNPELFDELGCLDYREHMGKRTVFVGGQLFLGVHPSTGTEAHSASNTNLFFQIYGKKKWTFVHPDYLWLMYPMLNRYFLFCASFVQKNQSQEYLDQYAPLQRYCPRYEATLEPGDVLLNPPWQWHMIDNVTDASIGVATRWAPMPGPRKPVRTNTFFDFFQLLSPAIWRLRFHGMINNPNEPIIIDESTRGLVSSQDDYIDFGRKGATQDSSDFHLWPKEYQFRADEDTGHGLQGQRASS